MSVNHYRIGARPDAVRFDRSAFVSAVADNAAGGTYGTARRFIVGGYADSVVIRATATRAQRAATAAAFAAAHSGLPVGFWRDHNGRTWLDVVQSFDNATDAVGAAERNGEREVWDAYAGRAFTPAELRPCPENEVCWTCRPE